jgi:hypothetical protein
MSARQLLVLLGMVISSSLWSAGECSAIEIVIPANQDTYIRFGSSTIRNTNFNGDTLITGPFYAPLVQFDLSSVFGKTITSAYMRGYLVEDRDGDYNRPEAFAQEVYLVDTDPNQSAFDGGLNETTMTWNLYVAALGSGATEVKMNSLGYYAAPAPSTPNMSYDFAAASEADLVALNARVTFSNPNQRYALFFFDGGPEGGGYRWWDDHEGGHPVELVLTVDGSGLPGDFNLDGSVDSADYVVWRKNPSNFEDQVGYDKWRAHFGEPNAGSGSLSNASVPEPGSACLLAATALVAIGHHLSRRGCV